jgi:hypothetical protein
VVPRPGLSRNQAPSRSPEGTAPKLKKAKEKVKRSHQTGGVLPAHRAHTNRGPGMSRIGILEKPAKTAAHRHIRDACLMILSGFCFGGFDLGGLGSPPNRTRGVISRSKYNEFFTIA